MKRKMYTLQTKKGKDVCSLYFYDNKVLKQFIRLMKSKKNFNLIEEDLERK